MKVLHLSTSDIEQGAARAAYRLHQGLQQIGLQSEMLVRSKLTLDSTVTAEKSLITKLGPVLNDFPTKFYPNRDRDVFSAQWFPDKITKLVQEKQPDIINLHWVANGFLQVENLRQLNRPIVWTLHDMWPFTGGCHYSGGCDLYQYSCGKCAHLKSKWNWDISRLNWHRKNKYWQNLNLTIVSPSQWLANCANESSLFRNFPIHVIPHGLDTEQFLPTTTKLARQLLRLPTNKKLILFGASPGLTEGNRKGIQYLLPALQQLNEWHDQIELIVFGALAPNESQDFGFPIHYLGKFHDDISLRLIYSSADVMVVPSVQEAFGQTASESLACGTPVVAFNATGLKDIVDHKKNGYLATPFDANDLANGISWILKDLERHQLLSQAARSKAEREFSLEIQAKRYKHLFVQLLECEEDISSEKISITPLTQTN